MFDNSEKYLSLINKYSTFIFEKYFVEDIDDRIILNFEYAILDEEEQSKMVFNHSISFEIIDKEKNFFIKEDMNKFDNIIFSIGLMESINYWKTVCSPKFVIKCGKISQEQKNWWKKLFYNGLGELIYLNGLSKKVNEGSFVNFICEDDTYEILPPIELETNGNIVPVGGGKDSVVSLELLKKHKEDNLCFVLNPPIAALDCIKKGGYQEYLLANRHFDKRLFSLNDKGYINGHVPYSDILAFISIFGAALTKKKYIVLSNEKSADESSVIGETYNHQYSKSFEFEKDFDEYVKKYIVKDITYFSILRNLYELDIAKLFSQHKEYHNVFRSCNKGKKENIWCSECAKCLFVYIILAPFMELEELSKIFNGNMLDKDSMQEIFKELIGVEKTKPFECVGTINEIRYSILQIVEKHYKEEKTEDLPLLIRCFFDEIDIKEVENINSENTNNQHLIPDEFLKLFN